MDNKEQNFIKELVEKIKFPSVEYYLKNKERYDEIGSAIYDIVTSLDILDANDETKWVIKHGDLCGEDIHLCIETDVIFCEIIDKFCDGLKKADGFEIVPRTDGKVEFNILFQGGYDLIGYR